MTVKRLEENIRRFKEDSVVLGGRKEVFRRFVRRFEEDLRRSDEF